ncbi:MAG: hypothetical protein FJY66_01635, partial [Calditrichaeota bacterium]|nr:hypothetical protein [Calditrichota bacterium]
MTVFRPRIELLSHDLIQSILDDAFTILARSGVMVENSQAQELLLEAGAKREGGRIKIRGELIEKCLKTVPSSIQFYDRFGELRADLGDDRSHFDPGSAALKILDYE